MTNSSQGTQPSRLRYLVAPTLSSLETTLYLGVRANAQVLGGAHFVQPGDDAVLGGSCERAFLADQGLDHGFCIRNRQPDSQRHQKWQIQQRPRPASGKQFALRD